MEDIFPYAMSFAVLGSMVLISYCTNPPLDTISIWAGLNRKWAMWLWMLTTIISIVAFLTFSIELMSADDDTMHNQMYTSNWYAYTTFLASSCMYMPLATKGYHIATIATLVITAASACCMVIFSAGLFGWNVTTVMLAVLAFHCTVVDLIYWGGTWWIAERRPRSTEYEETIDTI